MRPEITCFFDDKTNSASYVVSDPETSQAAIIDSVLDFDPVSGHKSNRFAWARARTIGISQKKRIIELIA